ncbi:MBL fold metallo-hydrolase [Actinoallomurus iriomotensis]|uniref:MBL fold metallo-hydrolase n=1 Tax=Actinoallomurus iriomotensis TaxID=478107 RepID=A0A9W6SCC8_9ACTN|nr:MBL fold metallo-hydrolase [Actinoallomurus iriomotensis]GLY89652.1 MBL fold metallo-hydrolase [Actinoallomurus iriomotensis]
MHFIDTVAVEGLGNRAYLAGDRDAAVVIDPPRDIDQVIAAAARRGVRITHVAETHIHNDYVTGGLDLARITGARYLVPAEARVSFARTPVADGDTYELGPGLTLQAVATPGHTPHHKAYVLVEGDRPVAAFTGGSLLIGTVGRPDLVDPRLTERLARAQHGSARRLARLPDEVRVLPTHGFGSFCSASQAEGDATTIGMERTRNDALLKDVDAFVTALLSGLDDIPAYYAHMGPVNAAGPAPLDLTAPVLADAAQIADRLAAGEWIVDVRDRAAFAERHLVGSLNVELDGRLAVYLAWLMPWGKPVTLLADSVRQLSAAQRELVRVGIDRPAAAAVGTPEEWATDRAGLGSYRRADFAALVTAHKNGETPVVLDVRRDSERVQGAVTGSVHIPLHHLRTRIHQVPDGVVWVHCGTGMRAGIAASILDALGREVVLIDDSFDHARTAGLTTSG